MALFKKECGHPTEWNLRVVYNSTTYTYCIGCIVEKIGLDNLEDYDNPFVKLDKKTKKIVEIKKEVKDINNSD